ncbi:MAG: hypothetical protein U1F55_04395 [Chitinivorax sp.]
MKPSKQCGINHILIAIGSLLINACAQPPSPVTTNAPPIEAVPELARYSHFELASQPNGNANEQKASGSLDFKSSSASFDVIADNNQAAGRLFVQPEICRDDPSSDCQRRFVVSGRINIFNTSLNCYIPIRNDVAIGYINQSLTGICQDRYGRSFSISIFAH